MGAPSPYEGLVSVTKPSTTAPAISSAGGNSTSSTTSQQTGGATLDQQPNGGVREANLTTILQSIYTAVAIGVGLGELGRALRKDEASKEVGNDVDGKVQRLQLLQPTIEERNQMNLRVGRVQQYLGHYDVDTTWRFLTDLRFIMKAPSYLWMQNVNTSVGQALVASTKNHVNDVELVDMAAMISESMYRDHMSVLALQAKQQSLPWYKRWFNR